MDNLKQALCWTDQVISDWKEKGIKLEKGISIEKIHDFEKLLNFTFPQDFIDLYIKINGFEDYDWNENMISIWSLKRIENEFGRYPNFIGFSDFFTCSHVYGFLKDQQGIFKNYDLTDPGVPEKIAETFEEAINLINTNSDLLY